MRSQQSAISNEKGIALMMVLVLSAISLAIMAGLIYMITSETQISGMHKRYKTALEAGLGGGNIVYEFINLREEALMNPFMTEIVSLSPNITTPPTCTGTSDISGASFTMLAAKLNSPTDNWAGCDSSIPINPEVPETYDISFNIGTDPVYTVYAKIVDTVEGNTGGDEGLLKSGVVSATPGEITPMSVPYLYTVEIDAQNPANPAERAKLSVLYQY